MGGLNVVEYSRREASTITMINFLMLRKSNYPQIGGMGEWMMSQAFQAYPETSWGFCNAWDTNAEWVLILKPCKASRDSNAIPRFFCIFLILNEHTLLIRPAHPDDHDPLVI